MIGRVLTADEWRGYIANYDFGRIPPTRLVLHHTYRPNQAQWRGLASMRGMQRYYGGLGWSSAPHIYVAPDGIWLFTPMSRVGIHAGTGNQGTTNGVWWYSIGLEMVGYFDYVRPAGAVWDYAKLVMSTVSQRLDIPPRRLISFHRDYTNQKSCPGWAVTKDWVFAEVEAALRNSSPPSVPVDVDVGKPTPSDEVLLDRLVNESYARRSKGYNVNWAFHQEAVQRGLGAPIGDSQRFREGGKEYSYQTFARETLYSQVPNWGTVLKLSQLLRGSIPPRGLGRRLLEASYSDGGATFHANWAFHQYAVSSNLGPAIGPSETLSVDGVEYAYQVFASDTLFNRVPNWADIEQLSRYANVTSPDKVRLRDALLEATYARSGVSYHPNWSFHQLARAWRIGTPLSDAFGVHIEGVKYNIQVYALDTLYNVVPHWTDVHRLSRLQAAQSPGATRSMLAAEPADLLGDDVQWEPPNSRALFNVVQYTHNPPPVAYGERFGGPISVVVLHGDPGPAMETLDEMADYSSHYSTHYYITADASIYQMIPEQYAAWHAGMATYDGIWQNLNRISIGVVLERPADTSGESTAYDMQRAALTWLLGELASRHSLAADAVVRWRDLRPDSEHAHSRVPLDDITLEAVPAQ
jgi:N-acetylmuramoyl-L-alanine amidase CwlA